MANATAHEIQDGPARREMIPIELCNSGDGPVIYVGEESGRPVEILVWRLVVASEISCWE